MVLACLTLVFLPLEETVIKFLMMKASVLLCLAFAYMTAAAGKTKGRIILLNSDI